MRHEWLRVCICCVAILPLTGRLSGQETATRPSAPPEVAAPDQTAPAAPMSDEEKADLLSDQVGKLMVKCVNLLTAGDPLALDYCKQQRDLADQYPPHQRMVDRMMAHDEYGIALAAFDRKTEALAEFDREIRMMPGAVKPGSPEWSAAYWHRAMVHFQLAENEKADRDYRAAEASLRLAERKRGDDRADGKMRAVLRQHAALLRREGNAAAAQKLLEEAAR